MGQLWNWRCLATLHSHSFDFLWVDCGIYHIDNEFVVFVPFIIPRSFWLLFLKEFGWLRWVLVFIPEIIRSTLFYFYIYYCFHFLFIKFSQLWSRTSKIYILKIIFVIQTHKWIFALKHHHFFFTCIVSNKTVTNE